MSIVTFFIKKIWLFITSRSGIIFYHKRLPGSRWTENWAVSCFLFIRLKSIIINLVSFIKSSIMNLGYSWRLGFWDLFRWKSQNTWVKSRFFYCNFFQAFYILSYFFSSSRYIFFSNFIKRCLNILSINYKWLSFCAWLKNTIVVIIYFTLIQA